MSKIDRRICYLIANSTPAGAARYFLLVTALKSYPVLFFSNHRNCVLCESSYPGKALPYTKLPAAGKALRNGLHAVIPFPTDRSMQSRFSGAIAKWLDVSNIDDLPPCNVAAFISTFSFTTGPTLNDRFQVPFTVSQPSDHLITVSIDAFVPALHIAAPAGTVSVDCILSVTGCNLKNGTTTGSAIHTITIPFNNTEIPAQVLELNIPIPHRKPYSYGRPP